MAMREVLASAMKWWEPRRLIYNTALAALVLVRFYQAYPLSKRALEPDTLLFLLGLAIAANICYCAAYVPDLYVQLAGHDRALGMVRWVIFAIGTAFALILTYFWSRALIANAIF